MASTPLLSSCCSTCHVVLHARHDAAGLVAVEEAQREAGDVLEDVGGDAVEARAGPTQVIW